MVQPHESMRPVRVSRRRQEDVQALGVTEADGGEIDVDAGHAVAQALLQRGPQQGSRGGSDRAGERDEGPLSPVTPVDVQPLHDRHAAPRQGNAITREGRGVAVIAVAMMPTRLRTVRSGGPGFRLSPRTTRQESRSAMPSVVSHGTPPGNRKCGPDRTRPSRHTACRTGPSETSRRRPTRGHLLDPIPTGYPPPPGPSTFRRPRAHPLTHGPENEQRRAGPKPTRRREEDATALTHSASYARTST